MDEHTSNSIAQWVFSDLAAVTMVPRRLTEIASWHEHIPFASWMIRQLKPARFVELGVHKGDSYSAFCQAITESGLPTACFGIDTWQGEVHAGVYDDSVWQEFHEYHSQHFAGFSRLVRSTFDEALPYFENGSVDLLHIDGRHFYEDVKHDFETWSSKLSPRSVVLFHDINVRERDFGVWRYWDELTQRFPGRSISFLHGHGLGVLFHGDQLAPFGRRLCALNEEELRYLRVAFAALGKSVSDQGQVRARKAQAIARQEERDAALTQLTTLEKEAADLRQRLNLESASALALKQAIEQRDREIARLDESEKSLTQQIHRLGAQSAQAVENKELELVSVQRKLDEVHRSRSWRITRPLRGVRRWVAPSRTNPKPAAFGRTARFIRSRKDLLLGSALETIRQSPLFDAGFYLSHYPDVQARGIDPGRHYLLHGWLEGRDPSAAFSTTLYLKAYPDVARAGTNPLVHFLRSGQQEGRNAPASNLGPAQPNQVEGLGTTSAVVSAAQLRAEEALLKEIHDIRASGLFDETFYRAMYPDVRYAEHDPIRHYCEIGWKEGKNPSEDFDTRFYLQTYGDIAAADMNPFWHFVHAGRSEYRLSIPDISTRYERDVRFGRIDTDIQLIAMYMRPNWQMLRGAQPVTKGLPPVSLPHEDLTFYEPLCSDVIRQQVRLARQHGIRGFCLQLEDSTASSSINPALAAFVSDAELDLGICVQIDLPLQGLRPDALNALVAALRDVRYIRIANRPLLVVIVPVEDVQVSRGALAGLAHQLSATTGTLPFLLGTSPAGAEPLLTSGLIDLLDAALDMPSRPLPVEIGDVLPIDRGGNDIVPYTVVARQGAERAGWAARASHPVVPSVTLSRDNASLRPAHALIYTRFRLNDYRLWLDAAIDAARTRFAHDRRLVFLNAWNDWNEGLFLEPDRRGGYARLNETTRALLDIRDVRPMPRVSVIVPNFNHEQYLRRRLDSIYDQTYKNIEVILLDDCSTDGSRTILDEYARAHPEITRVIFNERNSGGPFRQWAKGIKAASGELVWIAESDDFCNEGFLESLVRCFDDEAVMLAYANCIFVDRNAVPLKYTFKTHLAELQDARKWERSYCDTAHNEVRTALGVKNTIPNSSGVVFRRPVEMPLLDDENWLSMVVAGDWMFYVQLIRGGKIAFSIEATNYFRRYEGSAAEVTYGKQVFYREIAAVSRAIALNYDVPESVLEQCRASCRSQYDHHVRGSDEQFNRWYDYQAVLQARSQRLPNVMVSTMGFYPGGAEILPIRLANEFKRQGLSVVLMSAALHMREEGIRNMVRNDVPVVETSEIPAMRQLIRDLGIEVLNTHQWHIQKYPYTVPNVFRDLKGHIASLHGMIEHGDAFGVTEEQLRAADRNVSTWVYTADKNLDPFSEVGLLDLGSGRFVKFANGMTPPDVVPLSRANMGIPDNAFVLCCVSRAIPDKGWAETIEAVKRARGLSGKDIRLILVGNGVVYDEYCQSGVPPFVYLAGFSENSVGHYAAADMGIMLTRFKSESFPLTVVDCLFAGRPYIATDVGDIRNMLTLGDQVVGSVFALDDWEVPVDRAAEIIARFATDQAAYQHALDLVGAAARRFRIDVVAADYIRLFERSEGLPPAG